MKKKILSFVIAICMVVTLLPTMAMTTEAAGTGTSSDPIVVYRNPVEDPAPKIEDGMSTAAQHVTNYVSGKIKVRPETLNTWKTQIIDAASVDVTEAKDVVYRVATFGVDASLTEKTTVYYNASFGTIPADIKAGYWFGWQAVTGKTADSIEEAEVKVVDSTGVALTGNLTVLVKGYVDVAWDVNGDGDTEDECDITQQIALNNTLADAKAAAEAAANAQAVEKTNTDADYAYTFDGWDVAVPTETIDVANAASIDGTVYTATFTKSAKHTYYDVTFDANEGSGTMDNQTFKSGEYQALTANTFERDGYNFVGWNTAADGTGLDYADKASITLAEDTTLYAMWEKIIKETVIEVANDSVEVVYGEFTSDDLLTLIAPKVVADNAEVEGAVVTITDLTSANAGTYEVTLTYAGDNDYKGSSTKATVVIKKATANVVVESQTVKYGENITDPIEANCDTIDVVAGLDGHDETYLVGQVQVAVPEEISVPLALYAGSKGYNIGDLSIDELKELLAVADEMEDETVGSIVSTLKDYADTIEKLIDTLKEIQDELPMDSELKISIVNEVTMPENVGVYLIGSIAADPNYEAVEVDGTYSGMDAGYLIITPNGIKAELTWNETDDNDIITLGKLSRFDLGATATIVESTVEGAKHPDSVDKHVEYLFVGIDEEGELLLDRTTDPKAFGLDLGVYAQVAYVANWDNVMYYAEPIARPIIVAPNVADVAILDVNGNENYAQVFTYDGTPKSVTVTVDGEENVEGLTVEYIGSDTTVDGWYRTEAPTDAGVYTIVATYTQTNANGKLVKAGGAVGVMVIEPADIEVGLEDATYTYDGNQYFATITNPALDYITIAIDRDENIAYVNLPEDTEAHIDRIVEMLPAEVETEVQAVLDQYADFDGDVQTSTIKAELTDVIEALIAVDMSEETVAMAKELVDQLATELENSEEIQALVDELQAQLDTLEEELRGQIPDDMEATLEDYIRDIVTVNDGVDIDVDKVKADLEAKIKEVEAELPAAVVTELKEMVNEVIAVLEANVDVEAIEAELDKIVEKVESLEAVDAETVVKYILGAAYGVVDMSQVEELLTEVVEKVEARGYVEYLVNMAESIASMYGGDIDTTEVTEAVEAFVDALEAKLQSGTVDSDDLEALETYMDAILGSLLSVVDQIPEGTIIFGQNPSEVGVYDCYAINISANYKAEFVEAVLEIVEPEEEPVIPDNPVVPDDPQDPVTPDDPKDPVKPVIPESPKTGDLGMAGSACMVLLIAACVVLLAAVYGRRKLVK